MSTPPPSNEGPNPILAGFALGILLLTFTLCTVGIWFLPKISETFNLGLGAAPGQSWSPPTEIPTPTDTPIPVAQPLDPTPTLRSTQDEADAAISTTPIADLPAPDGPQTFQIGDLALNVNEGPVNLRRSPGFVDKPVSDRIGLVPPGDQVEIIGGPKLADDLIWWDIRWNNVEGWMAEIRASGIRILQPLGSQ